jgi:transcriptional regulator with XRE-family HTH domain
MSAAQAFGPNLRRARVIRRISLEQIARETKVSVDLWEAMERNDFSRWPTGIYARAYIREYAEMIGVDPDVSVDEFCRWFPQGDRRAERLVRGQAELLQHSLTWNDDVLPDGKRERRATAPASNVQRLLKSTRSQRLVAAGIDVCIVFIASGLLTVVSHLRFLVTIACTGLLYHGTSLIIAGASPAVLVIDAYASARFQRRPRSRRQIFLQLRSSSDES